MSIQHSIVFSLFITTYKCIDKTKAVVPIDQVWKCLHKEGMNENEELGHLAASRERSTYAIGRSASTGENQYIAKSSILETKMQKQTDLIIQSPAESSNKKRDMVTISLRYWIKQALYSIGNANGRSALTSQAYLESALKVAKSLTDQIIQAEELFHEYGISTKLESLTINDDWADHVTIQIYDENNNCTDLLNHDELLSLPENEKLDTFLKSDEREIPTKGETVTNVYAIDQHDTNGEAIPLYQMYGKTADTNEQDLPFSSPREDVNYLHIDSAQIQCPEGKCISKDNNSVKQRQRRIYFLGLLFYELFTGGEVPPENLRAIAMCTNAFVSLSTLTLVNKLDEDQTSSNDNNKRHQSASSSVGHMGLCKISCEYLRLTGISSSICTMIFNMLDSVYGELSGNESYTSTTQVASDLQLMIEKPSKFLRGLDMEKLSVSGLPLIEVEIPREEELEAIKSCYNRSISASSEIAIIIGNSGTGKSWLACRLAESVVSTGGWVLTGKFDQIQQSKPFHGKVIFVCIHFEESLRIMISNVYASSFISIGISI